jgi:tetratricopeptide (TPR) repeat protein
MVYKSAATACLLIAVSLLAGFALEATARTHHAVRHQSRHKVVPRVTRHQPVRRGLRQSTKCVVKTSAHPVAAKAAVKKAVAADVAPDEPRTPPGYETQTQLLARAYRLRDQALNEQMKGDHGLAVKHLLDATQLSTLYYGKSVPQEALLYFDLGVAASGAEQNDVAREAFRQCLERDPKMSEAQMRLAMVLAREGKQAEALTYARQAVELQPEDSRAHLVLSLLLERQGQVAEAQAEKDKARRLAKAAGITTPKELLESEAAPESTDASKVQPEAPDGTAMPLPADPDSEL